MSESAARIRDSVCAGRVNSVTSPCGQHDGQGRRPHTDMADAACNRAESEGKTLAYAVVELPAGYTKPTRTGRRKTK
jgi:hypothetical protein